MSISTEKVIVGEFDSTKDIFCFISVFMENYRKAKVKLPYHINLIDELHANENAHSRILAKLLQQKTAYGKFEIFESFIQFLKEKSASFEKIDIKNPDITQEIERIDVWIKDEDYAIIVENKIQGANDQAEQLARYIDSSKGKGFRDEQIYVIYLSRTYDKMPDEQTWGNYEKQFEERYLNLSFREDILSWLTDKVLPNVRIKDKFLSSSLEQYIDHLEGMFDLRKTNNHLNMELQEFIKKELGLNGNPQEDIAKLAAKQEEINKVNNQLQSLIDKAENEIFQEWKIFLKKNYPGYKQIDGAGAGLIIPIKNTEVQVTASIVSQQFYCQADTRHLKDKDEKLPQEVIEKVGNLLPRKGGSNAIWAGFFPRYAYEKTFDLLLKVINSLLNDTQK